MYKLNRVYLLIVTFMTLIVFNCKSQNLIANGSFENYTNPLNCLGGFDNYNSPTIYHVLDNWYGVASPDYFNSICTNGPQPGQYGMDIPANYFGYSQSKDGNAYVGAGLYYRGSVIKEYFYQHLASPLVSGKTYCLSFFVTRSDKIPYALKNIGAYFSNSLPTVVNGYEINATPQVVNTGNYIADTVLWTQIQGCFIANGGEQYVTIGNFTQNSMTDTLNAGTNNLIIYGETVSYYFFDDFTLIDQTTVGLDYIAKTNEFEIYPNPNTGLLKFSNLQYSNGDYNVKILDLFGKEIINEVLKEELDISSFDKGVYTLLLYKNKQLIVTKKVMKN